MKKIFLEPFQYEGLPRIAIRFQYDEIIINKVRLIPGRKWSGDYRIWHINFSEEKLTAELTYLQSNARQSKNSITIKRWKPIYYMYCRM